MTIYFYWPVAGAAQFWKEPRTLPQAKAALPALREKWPAIEVERVLVFNGNSRRYYRWRSGRWSTDDPYDPTPEDLGRWR